MFWPTDLAAIYPHPASHYYLSDQWPGWEICAAGLLLLAISALCLCQIRRRPYLAVGWFWYLGMLVPVIGLIQAGEQAMADRYTYLPLIGPVIALVWLISELARPRPARLPAQEPPLPGPSATLSPQRGERAGRGARLGWLLASEPDVGAKCRPGSSLSSILRPSPVRLSLAALALLALSTCAILTRHQLHYWRDSVSLFQHTVDITADNPGAQFGLGVGLEKEGKLRQAMVHYRVAVSILPAYADAHFNIGHLLRTHGHRQAAAKEFLTAIRLRPGEVKFRLNLAGDLMELGQTREAVQGFEEALQIDPDSTEALNNLAWLLAANSDPAIRDGARAVEYGERACRLTDYKQTTMVGTLAAAYAEAGRFPEAVATAEKACALAAAANDHTLLEKNLQLLELYRAGKPYHEPAAKISGVLATDCTDFADEEEGIPFFLICAICAICGLKGFGGWFRIVFLRRFHPNSCRCAVTGLSARCWPPSPSRCIGRCGITTLSDTKVPRWAAIARRHRSVDSDVR